MSRWDFSGSIAAVAASVVSMPRRQGRIGKPLLGISRGWTNGTAKRLPARLDVACSHSRQMSTSGCRGRDSS